MADWMEKLGNGWLKLFAGIAVTLALAWGSYAISQLERIDGKIETHTMQDGHPVTLHRLKNIEESLAEMRRDLKELLARTGRKP